MVDELKILNFSYFYEFALQNKVFHCLNLLKLIDGQSVIFCPLMLWITLWTMYLILLCITVFLQKFPFCLKNRHK